MCDIDGIYNLGYCYKKGIGVEKDEHLLSISAERNVGNCYRNEIGVEKNEHIAFFYFQKAVEMGIFIQFIILENPAIPGTRYMPTSSRPKYGGPTAKGGDTQKKFFL
ncbi:hypothetical protein C2G38_2194305 [Gigaspora rosea]|uniref:Uncharacterized protein n=1 Tax=Gigaspora rosea TaxID=44941 RepID=A0A397V5Y9_9GLOM|nr:hypothetical protein C2G38_2194305 [Gigaspora rosea]